MPKFGGGEGLAGCCPDAPVTLYAAVNGAPFTGSVLAYDPTVHPRRRTRTDIVGDLLRRVHLHLFGGTIPTTACFALACIGDGLFILYSIFLDNFAPGGGPPFLQTVGTEQNAGSIERATGNCRGDVRAALRFLRIREQLAAPFPGGTAYSISRPPP